MLIENKHEEDLQMPDDKCVTRAECELKNMSCEEKFKGFERRVGLLEDTTVEIHKLATNVEVLATNLTHIIEEQLRHSKRLDSIESAGGKRWETLKTDIIKILIGMAAATVAIKLGLPMP